MHTDPMTKNTFGLIDSAADHFPVIRFCKNPVIFRLPDWFKNQPIRNQTLHQNLFLTFLGQNLKILDPACNTASDHVHKTTRVFGEKYFLLSFISK